MIRRPPRSTRTDTLFPYTTLFRSISEKQEEVRELLLKRRSAIQGSNSISRSLVMIFVETVDILEQSMASHIDYRLLHERFESTGILQRYRQLIFLMADELENIASAVVSNSRSRSEERRVGEECVGTCRFRWWPYH